MFGIGSTELAIILVFGFLLFGPDKLPQMGRTIGRALRQFRETQEKLTSVVQSEVVDPMTAAVNEPTRPRRVDDDDDDADASAEEAEALAPCKKLGVVVQTTQSRARLADVVSVLLSKAEEVRVMNTICEATSGHQGACAELAAKADVMVVIGGRISANTTRLAEISRGLCPATHHIEGADELLPEWFEGAEVIGITAGASTPASQIEAVRDAIQEMLGA